MAEFDLAADDLRGADSASEGAADPVGDGINIVHPVAPKDGEGGVWNEDAVEEKHHDEEEWKDIGDDRERGRECRNPLTPAHLEEVE